METRNLRKERTGVVVSNKMEKSITVAVKWKEKHNDEFIEEIDKLIKKGYTFFILKKDKKTKVKVDSASDINKRKVVIEKETKEDRT